MRPSPDPLTLHFHERQSTEFERATPVRSSMTARVDDPPVRRRPGWLVIGLAWATFGLYAIIWSGLNWAELKRIRRDPAMYPVWHAIAVLVPIYGLFRLHANFRLINETLETTRSPNRVRPLMAVATLVAGNLLAGFPAVTEQLMAVNLIVGMSMVSWVVYHGQSGMNAFWDASKGWQTDSGIRLGERLLIGFGAGLWFVLILSLLSSPT